MVDEEYWASKPVVLGVADLAQITRKGEATIWSWLKHGRIISHNIAGSWITYREVFHHQVTEPDVDYPLPVELLGQYPEELTVAELAELLGKTKQTVWRWLRDDQLPGVAVRLEESGIEYKNDTFLAKKKGSWVASKTGLVELLRESSNQADLT